MAEKSEKQAAVIQAVKAVAVLVAICLVCVILLALCNDLFYISDDVRLSRSMQTVYKDFDLDTSYDYNNVNSEYGSASYGKVNKVYRSTDGAFVIEAIGNGGYSGGNVTLYVVVGADAKIIGWAVKENVGQSFIDRIPSNAGTTWYVGESIEDDLAFNMTGATVMATSTAIYNAVQMAAYYCHYALAEEFGLEPSAPPTEDDTIAKFHVHDDGTAFVRDGEFDETLNEEFATASYGEVLSVARCAICGAYVLEAVGVDGYDDGTITLYVVVDSDATIEVWSVKENVGQSYLARLPEDAGTTWYVGESIALELNLTMTGATITYTSRAIWNSVNMAAYYCRTALKDEFGLGEIVDPAEEALNVATELLADTDYSSYELTRYNYGTLKVGKDTYADTLKSGDDVLSYIFEGKGSNGVIYAYVFGEGDNLKVIVLKDGVLVAKTDNVDETDGIYVNVTKYSLYYVGNDSGEHGAVIATAIVNSESDEVVYTVESYSTYVPSNYKLIVTISNGVVTGVEIADGGNGYEEGDIEYGDPLEEEASALISGLIGATLDNIDSMYDDGVVTGATQSANLITAAVKAALAHYEANFAN